MFSEASEHSSRQTRELMGVDRPFTSLCEDRQTKQATVALLKAFHRAPRWCQQLVSVAKAYSSLSVWAAQLSSTQLSPWMSNTSQSCFSSMKLLSGLRTAWNPHAACHQSSVHFRPLSSKHRAVTLDRPKSCWYAAITSWSVNIGHEKIGLFVIG